MIVARCDDSYSLQPIDAPLEMAPTDAHPQTATGAGPLDEVDSDIQTEIIDVKGALDGMAQAFRADQRRDLSAAMHQREGWYVAIGGNSVGPYPEEEVIRRIAAGELTANDAVWHEQLGDWQQLSEVAQFREELERGRERHYLTPAPQRLASLEPPPNVWQPHSTAADDGGSLSDHAVHPVTTSQISIAGTPLVEPAEPPTDFQLHPSEAASPMQPAKLPQIDPLAMAGLPLADEERAAGYAAGATEVVSPTADVLKDRPLVPPPAGPEPSNPFAWLVESPKQTAAVSPIARPVGKPAAAKRRHLLLLAGLSAIVVAIGLVFGTVWLMRKRQPIVTHSAAEPHRPLPVRIATKATAASSDAAPSAASNKALAPASSRATVAEAASKPPTTLPAKGADQTPAEGSAATPRARSGRSSAQRHRHRSRRDDRPPSEGVDVDDLLSAGRAKAGASKRRDESVDPDELLAAGTTKRSLKPEQAERVMRQLRARAASCFERFGIPGTLTLRVTVEASGTAKAKAVGSFAETPTGACVASAVPQLRFPAFDGDAVTFNYPFALK